MKRDMLGDSRTKLVHFGEVSGHRFLRTSQPASVLQLRRAILRNQSMRHWKTSVNGEPGQVDIQDSQLLSGDGK